MTEGIEVPKLEKNQNARKKKETYKYLEILEVDTIQQPEVKKIKKRPPQQNNKTTWNQTT